VEKPWTAGKAISHPYPCNREQGHLWFISQHKGPGISTVRFSIYAEMSNVVHTHHRNEVREKGEQRRN
jgi:hypothetical protein